MSSIWRRDPGPCPICGAPHTACTAESVASLAVPQLPARDASAPAAVYVAPQLRAEIVQATLGPNDFTTGTYRGVPGSAGGLKRPRRR